MTMDTMTERRLLGLLDERDIHDVLMRYCRGVDRCDLELINSCYHADAIDDHGSWVASGADAGAGIVGRGKAGAATAMHFMGNVSIDVQGDTAFTESYLLAFRSFEQEGKPCVRTRALRFVDRFSKRNGQWRISERVVADDWNRVDEGVQTMPEAHLFRRGSKDRDDPVYAIRSGRVAREPAVKG